MPDIDVFDAKNKSRHLGTLKMDRLPYGETVSLAVRPALSIRYSDTKDGLGSITAGRLDFTKEWLRRCTSEGPFHRTIEERLVLLTDEGLDKLCRLDVFRLPGETHREALRRRESRAFF